MQLNVGVLKEVFVLPEFPKVMSLNFIPRASFVHNLDKHELKHFAFYLGWILDNPCANTGTDGGKVGQGGEVLPTKI